MIAGIDTHKDTLAVAVIDTGRQLAGAEVRNTEAGFAGLVELLEAHQVTSVGIEGSGNFAARSRSTCWCAGPRPGWCEWSRSRR